MYIPAFILANKHPFFNVRDYRVSTTGAEVNYMIKHTGFGDICATGSVNDFLNVHVQEGGAEPLYIDGTVPKAEDLVYYESSTATGDITLFDKVMNYNSKITGFTEWNPHT